MGESDRIQPTEETTRTVIARGFAQLIDYIAYFLIFLAFSYIYFAAVNPKASVEAGVELLTIPGFLSLLAYNTLFEAYWNGQTIGKRVTGIKVVNRHGADPSLKQTLIRNIPSAVPIGGTMAIIAALVMMATTDLRQRNFDIFADTYVVAKRGQVASKRRSDNDESATYEFQNFGAFKQSHSTATQRYFPR
jgi:uncharacterized RDD family membrane protein YckC